MSIEMTAVDVLEMARKLEAEASDFYGRAASAASRSVCRRLLRDLASMEVEHEQVFASLEAQLPSGPPQPESEDASRRDRPDGPGLTRMLISGVKEDLAQRFTGEETDEEVLRKALVFEKDTIVLFLHMKDYLATDADRERIDRLVTEEIGHVLLLTGQLASPAS